MFWLSVRVHFFQMTCISYNRQTYQQCTNFTVTTNNARAELSKICSAVHDTLWPAYRVQSLNYSIFCFWAKLKRSFWILCLCKKKMLEWLTWQKKSVLSLKAGFMFKLFKLANLTSVQPIMTKLWEYDFNKQIQSRRPSCLRWNGPQTTMLRHDTDIQCL